MKREREKKETSKSVWDEKAKKNERRSSLVYVLVRQSCSRHSSLMFFFSRMTENMTTIVSITLNLHKKLRSMLRER